MSQSFYRLDFSHTEFHLISGQIISINWNYHTEIQFIS